MVRIKQCALVIGLLGFGQMALAQNPISSPVSKPVKTTDFARVNSPTSAMVPRPTKEDAQWILPKPKGPDHNPMTAASIKLGEALFFDPRLSAKQNMSCATCHNPSLGWSDGLKTARGHDGKLLGRATPPVSNAAFSTILMWDGRKPDLENQALGPMESEDEMNTDFAAAFEFLKANAGYMKMFSEAYPGEEISKATLGKAIANYQRSIVINNTPFDKWLAGERTAINMSQWRGFQLFKGEAKCNLCHSAPNFTDSGFHNIGLKQWGEPNADVGRFAIRKVGVNKGAFKTPPLRDITNTAPYFHDGSAATLDEVIEHYAKGGEVKTNLSPNLFELQLTEQDKKDLVAFMQALQSPKVMHRVPKLP